VNIISFYSKTVIKDNCLQNDMTIFSLEENTLFSPHTPIENNPSDKQTSYFKIMLYVWTFTLFQWIITESVCEIKEGIRCGENNHKRQIQI